MITWNIKTNYNKKQANKFYVIIMFDICADSRHTKNILLDQPVHSFSTDDWMHHVD